MSVGCPYVEVVSTNPAIPGGWYVYDQNRGFYRLTTFDPTTCVETKDNYYLALKGTNSRDVEWVFSHRLDSQPRQAGQVTYPLVKKYNIYTGIYSDDPALAMANDESGSPSFSTFTTFTTQYRVMDAWNTEHVVESDGRFAYFAAGNLPKTIQDQNGVKRYLHGYQVRIDELKAGSRFDDYVDYEFETTFERIDAIGASQTPAGIPFFLTAAQLTSVLSYSKPVAVQTLPINHSAISRFTNANEHFYLGDVVYSREFLNFGAPNNRPFYYLASLVPSAGEHVKEIYPTDPALGTRTSQDVEQTGLPIRSYWSSNWDSINELASFPSNDQELCPVNDYNNGILNIQILRSINNQNPCTPSNAAPGVPENLDSTLVPDTGAPGVPENLDSTLIPDNPGPPENLQSEVFTARPPYNGTTIASKYKGWVFDERTSAISGPFVHEDVTAIATKDNSAEMFCVTENKEVKKTDLLDFNNPNFPVFSDPWPDIKSPFDGSTVKGVVASESAKGFCYRNRYLSAPFEDSVIGGGVVEKPLYFRDSYLAQSESNWMHLGDEHSEKQCYRVDLRFHKNSCGHLWLYVKNDEGLVKGQYKGVIKEHMKVFTNLRGRSFKIHMLIATHHDHPWAMREMAIGHLYGKSF
jgi:hypothetical protein